jgi:hypothetical protein
MVVGAQIMGGTLRVVPVVARTVFKGGREEHRAGSEEGWCRLSRLRRQPLSVSLVPILSEEFVFVDRDQDHPKLIPGVSSVTPKP